MISDLTRAVQELRDPESGVALVVEHSHDLRDVTDVSGHAADLLQALGNGFTRSAFRAAEALAAVILRTGEST